MTDKKRIDEAVKKEIAAADAQPEPEDVAAPQPENAVPTVGAEPPQPPSPPEKPCDDTSRLVDAILGLNAKIGALEDSIAAMSAENAALKSENARLSAESARLGAPVDYAAAIENDERAEAAAIASERVRNAVVAAYLKNLGSAERISVLTGSNGAIPLAPPAKPKSLAEAKKLAEILIKG